MKRVLSTYRVEEFINITNTLLKKRIFFLPIIRSTRFFFNYSPFCYRAGYCLKQDYIRSISIRYGFFRIRKFRFEQYLSALVNKRCCS